MFKSGLLLALGLMCGFAIWNLICEFLIWIIDLFIKK